MAQKQLTVEKIVAIVKEKWSLFGISTSIVFLLQLLSSKVLLSVFLGLILGWAEWDAYLASNK